MTRRNSPRWLSEADQQAWQSLVKVMIEVPFLLDAQLQRDANLSHFEYGLLARISESDGGLQLSQLAADSHASPSRLSHAFQRLEARGLVTRSRLPEDGRISVADLTKAGRAHLKASAPSHVEEVRRLIFDRLSHTQIAQLKSICEAISAE
jgi:DNA-binding MarR family transcriptional regulator